jgi:hydroxymethylpyrimidine/phosphomethylpyrimidine kinase
VHPVPPAIVAAQIEAVLDDIGADVIKTGMLTSVEIVTAVKDVLHHKAPRIPRVIDPVMQASAGGQALLPDSAASALKRMLVAGATVVTPNLPEAEILTGKKIRTISDMESAIPFLHELGAAAVLLKGGHLEGDMVVDLLITDGKVTRFTDPRIPTTSTHGTGCTLASAIAAGLASGLGIEDAVTCARAYVRKAMETAPGLGKGKGPLNHGHTVVPFKA